MTLYIWREVAEAVRFQTHDWKIVGSNPDAFIIYFLKDQDNKEQENKLYSALPNISLQV